MPKIYDMCDPLLVPDTFVVDLAAIDQLGPNVRLTFTTPYRVSEREIINNVVLRVVTSKANAAKMAQMMAEAPFEIHAGTPVDGEPLRH